MTGHREQVLRIERTFDAPADRVFDAWTSEEVLRRWLHGMRGWETPTAEVDLRVGGRIRIVMRDPADGDEALEKVNSFRPSIVVTDLVMPRRTGLELLEALRDIDPTIAVILLTAQGSVESAVEAIRLAIPLFAVGHHQDDLYRPARGRRRGGGVRPEVVHRLGEGGRVVGVVALLLRAPVQLADAVREIVLVGRAAGDRGLADDIDRALETFWRHRAASAPTSADLRRFLADEAEYMDAVMRRPKGPR